MKFLESSPVRLVITALGLASSLIKLLDIAYPEIVEVAATIALWLVGAYIVFTIAIYLADKARDADGEKSYKYSARRYGIGYEQIEIDCFLEDTGAATVQRTVSVRAFYEIESLDNYLSVKEKDEEGNYRVIEHLKVRMLTDGYSISNPTFVEEPGRLSAMVSFTPRLRDGDAVQYQLEERLSEGLYVFNIDKADLEKREDPRDYFGWNINRPTRKLIVNLYYPKDLRPTFFRNEVIYATTSGFPSTRNQEREEKTLKDPTLKETGMGRWRLTLEVNYPMIGLIYALCWDPSSIIKK